MEKLTSASKPKSIEFSAFFDGLAREYTEVIERCFPRYREMLWALLDYLPQRPTFDSILELGCGTGNLSVLVRSAFPAATIHLVDISGESLDVCRTRLGDDERIVFKQDDFRQLNYESGTFDLVISSISIHHLTAAEKNNLFNAIYRWLGPTGIFTYADQFRGATDELYLRHIANWRQLSIAAGSSEGEFEMWMDHQRDHDHHDTLAEQFDWLSAAGFTAIDCTWRYLLWSVVQAQKS